MKLKLSELNANPFKKEINGGKLNKAQVDKIKSNLEELGFMGSLPVFKKNNEYFLISGHHRKQALIEVFGDDYLVEVDIKDYTEEQIFKGMVIENLTQRGGEFAETKNNLLAIENYLNNNPEILTRLRESRKREGKNEGMKTEYKNKAVAKDVCYWIDKEKNEIIYHDEVTNYLNIAHVLVNELQDVIEKKHDKPQSERDNPDTINYSQAVILSKFDDYQEQMDLVKQLKESPEQRVREQAKLISIYKDASDSIKQQIRNQELDISDIEREVVAEKMDESTNDNEKTKYDFSPSFDRRLNNFSINVFKLEGQIGILRKIFLHDTFKQRYNTLGFKEKDFVKDTIKSVKERIDKCKSEIDLFYDRMEL